MQHNGRNSQEIRSNHRCPQCLPAVQTPRLLADIGFTFKFCSSAYLSRMGFCVIFFLCTGFTNAFCSVLAGFR